MIDAVNLPFAQHGADIAIEGARRVQVPAEGLFDHHSPPGAILLLRETSLPKLLHHDAKQSRRGRQVVEIIPVRGVLSIYVRQRRLETRKSRLVPQVSGNVVEALDQPIAELAVFRSAPTLDQVLAHLLSKLVFAQRIHREADQRKIVRHQVLLRAVLQRGKELPLRQVSGRPENDHYTRVARTRLRNIRLFGHRYPPVACSTCPPNL